MKRLSLFVTTTDYIYILSDRWGLVSLPTLYSRFSLCSRVLTVTAAKSSGVQCHIQRRHTQHSTSSSSSDSLPFPSSAVFPNIEGDDR